jgi:CRISPR/Cas system-associated exonuclease Cas4 (RecB family)
MKLTTPKAITDFQTCALLFEYRHNQKLPETIGGRDLLATRFENTLKEIIYYFFYKKQGGYTPSYASLLNRWEKLWFADNISSYDIMTEQHESAYGNTASLTTKAAGALLAFYESYSDETYIPIAINEEYIIPVTKKVKLKDKIDVILFKDNKYYVIKIMFNYRNNHQHMYQVDFAAMRNAFAIKHQERVRNAYFGYIDLLQPKVNFIDFETTKEDIDSLTFWANEMVEEEIFAPRRGLTWYCKKCPFDKPCSKWSNWKKDEQK